jgi:hypothetical protein
MSSNLGYAGILWHEWNEETERQVAERNRPVLLFVANPDPMVAPFLNLFLRAAPLNARLRELLHDYYIAIMIRADALPEYFADMGAGRRYNLAVLSPAGLTPLAVIDPSDGRPEAIVETVAELLTRLKSVYS